MFRQGCTVPLHSRKARLTHDAFATEALSLLISTAVVYFLIVLHVSRALKLLECDRAECGVASCPGAPPGCCAYHGLIGSCGLTPVESRAVEPPTGRSDLPWVPLS
jgi:hypothetical protein